MAKGKTKMGNLGNTFEEFGMSLFDSDKIDLLESYTDMTIGEIYNLSEKVKDIPVCRTFVAVVNTVSTIRDCFLIQKFLRFKKRFHDGKIDESEIKKRRIAAENKEKWIRHEIELILLRIDNISDKRNIEILCGVYVEFLNGNCSWEKFEEIALILERFIYSDTEQLKEIYDRHIRTQQAKQDTVIGTMFENNHCDRLVALGLVWQKYTAVLNGGITVEYCLTEVGNILAGVL